MEQKELIRRQKKELRNSLPIDKVCQYSSGICRNLIGYLKSTGNVESPRIFGYYPLGNEASLVPFYKFLLDAGIPLAFPKVTGDSMEFYQIHAFHELREGSFHVMEPMGDNAPQEDQNAMMLLPGIAFGKNGVRYGYGKGYYDRYLQVHRKFVKIGIAYSFQLEEYLPGEQGDVPVDAVITEKEIHRREQIE